MSKWIIQQSLLNDIFVSYIKLYFQVCILMDITRFRGYQSARGVKYLLQILGQDKH